MKLTIRLKVIIISVIILFVAVGSTTLVTTSYLTNEYLKARKSEIFIIGQTLIVILKNMFLKK